MIYHYIQMYHAIIVISKFISKEWMCVFIASVDRT